MKEIFIAILQSWYGLSLWVAGLFIVFTVLGKLTPCNPGQPLLRKGMGTDLLYCFILPILNRFVRIILVSAGLYLIFSKPSQDELSHYFINGFGALATLPLWLQAAIIFLISDFLLYWIHRLFHGKTLWNFHAIHHSPDTLDWLATFRFHPINAWLAFTLVDTIMLLAGFSPAAVALFANFNLVYSAMVHANLNWTFGPLRYLFASPVFHRWHHTAENEGMNKNFAPTFPLLDVIFGTYYMPEGRLPQAYGIQGSTIPESFAGQIIWPFKN